MPVNQPIELEVFVVVTERVDELFCDFEQTHVKEKLEDGIDWNVEVNVHGHSPAPHVLALFDGVALLPSDDGEYEKDISSQGDDLNHGVIYIWMHCGFTNFSRLTLFPFPVIERISFSKKCQIVACISVTSQFHEFFNLIFAIGQLRDVILRSFFCKI